jgi:hypothetical protein
LRQSLLSGPTCQTQFAKHIEEYEFVGIGGSKKVATLTREPGAPLLTGIDVGRRSLQMVATKTAVHGIVLSSGCDSSFEVITPFVGQGLTSKGAA